MQNLIFVVNREPYCLWEIDANERNKEFLSGIDPEYFEYLAHLYINSDDEKKAAIALRSTLYHAMETMFSLLGAYIQAPDCAYAWIAKCSNTQLRKFVAEVGGYGEPLFTKLAIPKVTWHEVSKSIFRGYLPNTDKNEITVRLFADFWNRMAHEFLDLAHIDEYNSLKHGFRIRAGGFSLAVGLEHEYGVSPPQEEMKLIGHSEHGTTIFKLEPITDKKGNRSYRSKRHSLNWTVEKTALLLQLTSMAITNITSALKIVNGAKAGTCQFERPAEDEDFDKPWNYSTGVTSSMDYVFEFDKKMETSKEELQKIVDSYVQEKLTSQASRMP